MCGLAATLIGDLPNRGKLKAIVEVFTKNLLANEERGKEATGVAVLNRDGTLFVEKAPIQASDFVRTRSFADFVSRRVTMDAVVLLGHTREPTKGSPSNNHNNHPIVVGNTAGIHNGTITNDDEIFLSRTDDQDNRPKRLGSVDSEAIFALIDEIGLKEPMDQYLCQLKKAVGLLVGSYTTLSCNRRSPQRLLLLKYDKPISVHYSPDLQSLFFSSRYVFLRKAFGRSVTSEALPNKKGYIFDAGFLSTLGKEPLMAFDL
jgi:glucosamine 6-phosphate synthetase-like amidotransferase/phosphosugar isomerase protein